MATFTLTPAANDTFTGAAAQENLYLFTTADLQATDTVTGRDDVGFSDILALTAPGTVTAGQWGGVTKMEQLRLSTGTNNLTLTNGLVAGSILGHFIVADGSGDDTVDGSGITNGIGLQFYATTGNETFRGGNGANHYGFAASELTSADTVAGGAGFDDVWFSTAGAVAANAFSGVTNIESITLNAGGNSIALSGAITGSTLGYLAVVGGAGNDTVNLGGVTSGTTVIYAGSGADTLTGGGVGSSTYYVFGSANLTSADTITGGAGFDVVQLAFPGPGVVPSGFDHVSNLEAVFMNAGGGSSVILTDATVSNSSLGYFVIVGGSGAGDIVDAQTVTGQTMHFWAGTGTTVFHGGGGTDVLLISEAELTGSDLFAGRAGTDYLQITTNGTVTAAELMQVSGIEFLGLSAGGSVELVDHLADATTFYVTGSSAADTFDGSAVTAYGIQFHGFGGADALTGGTQSDSFYIQDSAFASIDGNGGIDYLVATQANQVLNVTALAANISNIEAIWLDQAADTVVTLAAADIGTITPGNVLYVVGDTDDSVDVGNGWVLMNTGVTNASVAPGYTFNEFFHSVTGATVFIEEDINATVGAIASNPPVVALDGPDANDYTTAYTTGEAAGVNIADDDATVDDPDTVGVNANIVQLDAAITNVLSNDGGVTREFLQLSAAGQTIATNNGLTVNGDQTEHLTINGVASDAIYQFLLREIVYVNLDERGSSSYADRIITVDVQDQAGATADQRTTTIDLTNGNQAPIAVEDTIADIQEDSGDYRFLASLLTNNDSDPDGNAIHVSTAFGGVGGSISQSPGTGELIFHPTANFHGPASFKYGVTDSNGADSNIVTVTFNITPVNDAPTGGVTITGIQQEDQVLTADTSTLADPDGLGTLHYQWQRDDGLGAGFIDVGLDQNTYTLGDADVGATIQVTVSYTDNDSTPEQVTSAPTGAIANVNDAPTGGVTITGTVQEDQVLTADTISLQDPDGLGTLHYQWQRDDGLGGGFVDVGLDQNTYTLGDADVGAAIRVIVDYIDQHGMPEQVTSAGTAPVANVNDDPTGDVVITGTATEDQVLTADTSALQDLDGLATFDYLWQRDDGLGGGFADIVGSDHPTYTLGDDDVGATIRVIVSYTDGHSTPESVTSGATGPVANVNDAPTGDVTITGTAAEDFTLTADTTALEDDDGLGPLHYQWQRDTGGGFVNVGADQDTYTLGEDDVGATIQVVVSYTDQHGTPEQVTSGGVGPVIDADDPPVNTVPGAQGIAEDAILTFSTGTGNAISIADEDAGANAVQVTLTATHGVMSLNGTTGLSFTGFAGAAGDGTADATMTFRGTIADINTALNGLTYDSDLDYNGSASVTITTDDLGFTGAGGPLTDTDSVTVNISAVNDAPINTVPGTQTFNEDTNRTFSAGNGNQISISDVDAGAGSVTVQLGVQHGTLSLNGTVGISFVGGLGDGTDDAFMSFSGTVANINTALNGLVYKPALNYNSTDGIETLTINTNDNGNTGGGSLADGDSVTLSVTPVNDNPLAQDFTFDDAHGNTDAIGNTTLATSFATAPTDPHKTIAANLLTGATDVDSDGGGFTITATDNTNSQTNSAGTITFQTNGEFVYRPAAGFSGTATFQYRLHDGDNGFDDAQIQIAVADNHVWYVNNTAAAGGDGTSDNPFNSLASLNGAGGAGDVDGANDTIFIYAGDGNTTGQNSGIILEAGQHLLGQGVDLVVDGVTLVTHTTQARLGNSTAGGNGVSATNLSSVEIAGLSISGAANAIDLTISDNSTGTANIHHNTIFGAGAEGIDVNKGGTGTLTLNVHDNTWSASGTHSGTAVDIARTGGAINLDFSNNSNIRSTGADGVVVSANAGGGVLRITGFANNSVSGDTPGTGISITNARFDTDIGSPAFNQVSGGDTDIGTQANPVGGAGLVLTTVTGDLAFTDLDIFTSSGAGLTASTSTSGGVNITSGTGFRLVANGGNATIDATGGPAADITNATIDLNFLSVKSTNSTGHGVSLDGTNDGLLFVGSPIASVFVAGSGSAITNAGGTDVIVVNTNADVTYNGTITDDLGRPVFVSGNTGGTMTFGGAITDGDDGDGGGISVSGNSNTTVSFTGGITLSTGGNTAFTATGNNSNTTLTILDPGTANDGNFNKLTTTTGTALDVANTLIGSGGLTFRSISASGASSGIILNTTGTSGHLAVTGTGTAGSGGTIQNTTGDGISLTSTQDVNLGWMNITGADGNGILGTSVNGIVLVGLNVSGNADTQAENGIRLVNLTGDATHVTTFTNITVANSFANGVHIFNQGGTLTNLVVTGSTFSNTGASGVPGNQFIFESNGNGDGDHPTMKLTATGNVFSGNDSLTSRGLFVISGDGTVNAHVGDGTVAGRNQFNNNFAGIDTATSFAGNLNFDINNNTFNSNQSVPINYFGAANSTAAVNGFVRNNIIGVAGTPQSGSTEGQGITLANEGGGTKKFLVDSNTIQNIGVTNLTGGPGISVTQVVTAGGTVHATITNNTINNILNGRGITVSAFDNGTVNADVHGNTITNFNNPNAIRLNGDSLGVDGTINVPQASSAAISTANGGVTVLTDTRVFFNQPAPLQPTATPLLAAPGGVESASGAAGDHDLTQAELAAVVDAAIARWADAGLSDTQLAELAQVNFAIADLGGATLGLHDGAVIMVDNDAAGRGWFIDATPSDNVEFAHAMSGTRLMADTDAAPAGHMDLLTLVMHEMGHQLGLDDTFAGAARGDLMFGELVTGERRLPGPADAAATGTGYFDYHQGTVDPAALKAEVAHATWLG